MQFADDWEYYVTRRRAGSTSTTTTGPWTSPSWRASCGPSSSSGTRGSIYEGFRVVPYSWAAQTPLSNFETRLDNHSARARTRRSTVTFELRTKDGGGDSPQAAGLDDDALDAAVQPRARRPPEARLRLMERGRRALDPRRLVARALRQGAEGFAKSAASRAPSSSAAPTSRCSRSSPTAENAFVVLGGEFVELGEGTGVVHIAPAFGEDDLDVGKAPACRSSIRSTSAASSPPRCRRLRGQERLRGQQGHHPRSQGRRGRRPPRDLRAQLSALLADRPAADLQGDPSWYVKVTAFRDRMVELNQRHSPGCRSTSRTASSATGSPTPATGTSAATASGARRSRSGSRTIRHIPRIDVYGSLDEIERDFGVRPKDLHRPFIDELTRPNPDDPTGKSIDAPGRGRARLLVRVGLDALRPGALSVREQGLVRGQFPGRLHRRICRRRPAAGSTR